MLLDRLRLQGKVAIVTGAGRGLGKEMALALAEAGADVACAARTVQQIEETAKEVRARGPRALAFPFDVTKPAEVNALVARTVDEWGRLDILVANAGGAGPTALQDIDAISASDWQTTITLNLSSVFFSLRAAVPYLRVQGGAIITVASTTALRGDPRLPAYSAAKAGVIALTRSLAVRLAADQIRANCIVPGLFLQRPLRDATEIRIARARGESIPAGRLGEVWEVGPLALYLASDASSYVTGETFVIDGGLLAGGYAPPSWDMTNDSRGEPVL